MSIKADINISPPPDSNTLSVTCKTHSPRFPPDTVIQSPLNCHSRVENASIALLQRLMSSVLAVILHSTHNGRCFAYKETASIQAFLPVYAHVRNI